MGVKGNLAMVSGMQVGQQVQSPSTTDLSQVPRLPHADHAAPPGWKKIRLRFKAKCWYCRLPVESGTYAYWRQGIATLHTECFWTGRKRIERQFPGRAQPESGQSWEYNSERDL